MDCKSTNNYVGKRHMTVQNSLRNGNEKQSKMITRSISHSVKRMPQQNICKGRSIKNEQFNKDVGKRSKSSLRGKSNSDTFEAKQCLSSTNHTKKSKSEISINRNLNIHIQDNSVESSNKMRLMHIEQSITDMQNKILKLEQKSVLDEEKINIFKMVVLKQRNNDIKMLLDEKENELLKRMDLLYVDYEPERVCKLCLQLFDKKESLTSLVNDEATISLVNSTLNMKIELDNGTPTGLCENCLQQIERYDWMKRRSQKADIMSKKFVEMKKNLNGRDNPEESNFTLGAVTSYMFPMEQITDEANLEDNQFSNIFKIENTFSLENSSNVGPFSMEFIKEEPQSDEEEITTPIITELSTSRIKPKTVRRCRSCQTIFTNHWSANKHHNYCNEKYKCHECKKCYFNSKLYRMHKLRRQSCVSADIFRHCVLCNVSFRWKWQLVFHVLKHEHVSN